MILIGGAGLTGMVLGWELAKRRIPFLILEKEERPGGLLRTEKKGKYRFDYTGHLLHFSDERAENFVKRELKLELYKHRRHSFIHLETGLVPYPFQYHLYYLPGHLRNRAVSEFIKARTQNKTAGNFYDWIYSSFGKGIAELFMVPYNKKLWKYDLRKLGINWMGRFVPPAASSVLEGAAAPLGRNEGYNASFYYPPLGIEELILSLKKKVEPGCRREIAEVDVKRKRVFLKSGERINFTRFFSTLPLPELICRSRNIPQNIRNMGRVLKWRGVWNLNIGIRKSVKKIHWLYFPEPVYSFYRIGFASSFSPFLAPRGNSSLYIEASYGNKPEKKITEKMIGGLSLLGIDRTEIDQELLLDIPYAYALLDRETEKVLPGIMEFYNRNGIYSLGRFGAWNYSSMQESIIEGISAAKNLIT